MRSGLRARVLDDSCRDFGDLGVVLVLADAGRPRGAVLERALADFVAAGGLVVVEGQPGGKPEQAITIGQRIISCVSIAASQSGKAAADSGGDAAAELVPASDVIQMRVSSGHTAPPRLLGTRGTRGRVLIAPDGLFTLTDAAHLGVRSATARLVVNVLVWGLSR